MEPLQDLAVRLVGTWHSVLVSDERASGVVRFLEDLRYVGIQRLEPPLAHQEFVVWRMWCELESGSLLRMKFKKDRPGDVRDLHFEGETLVLKAVCSRPEGDAEPQKHVWHCHRLTDEEIPDWFEEQFRKAMANDWI